MRQKNTERKSTKRKTLNTTVIFSLEIFVVVVTWNVSSIINKHTLLSGLYGADYDNIKINKKYAV